jgi:hypothetical protein
MDDFYNITCSGELEDNKVAHGLWIVLYHADRIPPHLMLVSEGHYYSLSVKGNHLGEPVEPMLRYARSKKHKLIFFQVQLPSEIAYSEEFLRSFFKRYIAPEAGKITCLYPIREFLEALSPKGFIHSAFVFELFALLEKSGFSGEHFHLNMDEEWNNQKQIKLPLYSRADIDLCIQNLSLAGHETGK